MFIILETYLEPDFVCTNDPLDGSLVVIGDVVIDSPLRKDDDPEIDPLIAPSLP